MCTDSPGLTVREHLYTALLCVYYREEQTLDSICECTGEQMGFHAHKLGCPGEEPPCAASQVRKPEAQHAC